MAHASQQTFAQSFSTCISSDIEEEKTKAPATVSQLLKSPGQRTGGGFNLALVPDRRWLPNSWRGHSRGALAGSGLIWVHLSHIAIAEKGDIAK